MKVVITLEDAENTVHLGCDFGEEGLTDKTQSFAALMATEMMLFAGKFAKRYGGSPVDEDYDWDGPDCD